MSGLDDEAKKMLNKGVNHGGEHLSRLLKFLTVRAEKNKTKGGITLVGGAHDSKLDGNIAASTK
jgi:hypothetical protein